MTHSRGGGGGVQFCVVSFLVCGDAVEFGRCICGLGGVSGKEGRIFVGGMSWCTVSVGL
jgi:hypothetical protein